MSAVEVAVVPSLVGTNSSEELAMTGSRDQAGETGTEYIKVLDSLKHRQRLALALMAVSAPLTLAWIALICWLLARGALALV
jgi:hypothetical protein